MQEATIRSTKVTIRPAKLDDIQQVIRLDHQITGVPKLKYWESVFERYGAEVADHFFLVAVRNKRVVGLIIGELRAWEFGEPPCGWIFTILVDSEIRLDGIGSILFKAICDNFRNANVTKVRTMLARDAPIIASFFRSQGMVAGPFTELEMGLDE